MLGATHAVKLWEEERIMGAGQGLVKVSSKALALSEPSLTRVQQE